MNEDFSKEIFDTWFDKDRILRITLKNDKTIDGELVGFYHGEEGEPYIIKWDFIKEDDYKKLDEAIIDVPESQKMIIKQADIASIDFKYPEK